MLCPCTQRSLFNKGKLLQNVPFSCPVRRPWCRIRGSRPQCLLAIHTCSVPAHSGHCYKEGCYKISPTAAQGGGRGVESGVAGHTHMLCPCTQWFGGPVRRPNAIAGFIPQLGTKNWASGRGGIYSYRSKEIHSFRSKEFMHPGRKKFIRSGQRNKFTHVKNSCTQIKGIPFITLSSKANANKSPKNVVFFTNSFSMFEPVTVTDPESTTCPDCMCLSLFMS